MIIDPVFLLSEADERLAPQLQFFSEIVQSSQAAASINVSGATVPLDRHFWCQSAQWAAAPGGAQTVRHLTIAMEGPGGVNNPNIVLMQERELTAAERNTFGDLELLNPVLLPSGWRLTCNATFSAGVAANAAALSYAGILTPRGNLAP